MLNLALLLGLGGGAEADGLALVRSALTRASEQKELGNELVARRLVALGAPAAPGLLALVDGSGVELLLGSDDAPVLLLCPADRLGEVALLALAGLPSEAVLAALRAELAQRQDAEMRAVALRVLAGLRTSDGLALVFELLRACELELASPSLRAHARAALLGPLRNDARASARLHSELENASELVLGLVIEALAASESEAALAPLEDLLGRSPALDLAVIDGLAQAGERRPWRVGGEAAAVLERLLSAKAPARRAAAALALGRLARVDSIPRLVPRLDDPSPEVVQATVTALQCCAQRKELDTPEAWKHWLAHENEWWQAEGVPHVAALKSGESAAMSGHLRALYEHTLARAETADALLARLDRFEPGELVLACSTLARLGSSDAVPDLVPLLDAADASVRAAAWKALVALTGAELPAERGLWDAYAFD